MSRVTYSISHFTEISGYQQIALRINKTLQKASIQAKRYAYLKPLPSDHPEDWERILDEIELAENVRLTRIRGGNGRVRVGWTSS